MKRLLGLAMVSLALLSGCHQAPSGTAAQDKDKPGVTSEKTDASATNHSTAVFTPETRSLISAQEVPLLEQINRENVRVVSAARPSIVRITAVQLVDPRQPLFSGLPFPFHPGVPRNSHQNDPAYGSGVIISKDGYIVTNYHVLDGAATVEVQLQDQRTFPARIVASDAPVDIAILKIEATDLPAMPWGDSDKLQVGEQVFAIGNPFNLDDSVSKGIVSAKGRNLPDSSNYEDYIQTDAAINPGNSGGALVNIHGELIGINAAIASTSRGSMGVGFSIPSNLARYAVEGLIKQGRLVRGYLGVRLPISVDDGVTSQLGLDSSRGALLAGVQQSSPADLAKLRPVDFITGIDGHKIDSIAHLRLIVAQIPVGKQVVVNYIRAGASRSTTLKITEAPKQGEQDFFHPAVAPSVPEGNTDQPQATTIPAVGGMDNVLSGIQVADLNDKTRQKFGVEDIVTSGVVVSNVQEGSVADARGLLKGDVIDIACPRRNLVQPMATSADFSGLVKTLKADQGVVLLVHHGKSSGYEDKASSFIYLAPPVK